MEAQKGRWAVVLTDGEPPVFWSYNRSAIEEVCRVIRRRCPAAQIVWVDQRSGAQRQQEDIPFVR